MANYSAHTAIINTISKYIISSKKFENIYIFCQSNQNRTIDRNTNFDCMIFDLILTSNVPGMTSYLKLTLNV